MQPVCAVKTSPLKNLCAFYALANVIASKPEGVRKQAYANMGLDEEVAENFCQEQIDSYLGLYHQVSEKMDELRKDDNAYIVLAERLGSSFEVLTTFKASMSIPTQKERLLDEHSDYLFREEMISDGNVPPYTFKQFKQLIDIYDEAQRKGGSLLEALDKAVPFERDENAPKDFLQMGDSIDVYEPKAFPIILAEILKKTWAVKDSPLKQECAEKYTSYYVNSECSYSPTAEEMKADGILSDDYLGKFAVEFLAEKIIPHKIQFVTNRSDDLKIGGIFLSNDHFTTLLLKSEMQQRLVEAEIGPSQAAGGEGVHQQSGALKPYGNAELKLFCLELLGDQSVIDAIKSGTKATPNVKKGVSFYQGDDGDLCISIQGNELILNRQTINIDPSIDNTSDLRSKVIGAFVQSKGDIKSRANTQPPSIVAPQDVQGNGPATIDRSTIDR
jgi:hypothetical protein